MCCSFSSLNRHWSAIANTIATTSTPNHILVLPPANLSPCVMLAAFMVPPMANQWNVAIPRASDQAASCRLGAGRAQREASGPLPSPNRWLLSEC